MTNISSMKKISMKQTGKSSFNFKGIEKKKMNSRRNARRNLVEVFSVHHFFKGGEMAERKRY